MPSWNWDEQTDDEGMVHQSVANTDHNDATLLKQGYDIANPYLSADLVGYWPLQEDSGGTAYDFSGNNNDGTITNGATVNQTGLLGTSAYSFDGVDDYVNVPYSSSFGFTSAITVSLWFKANDKPGAFNTIYIGPHGFINRDQSNNIQCVVKVGGSKYIAEIPASSYNTGQWYLLTMTYGGETNTAYLNATNEASNTSPSGALDDTGDDLAIGAAPGTNYFNGYITDFRYYDISLSASEIQTLYDVVRASGDWLGTGKVI